MAGQGPDIFILPCDDGFTYNETQLVENVEKGMATGLFADLTTLYNQDETLQKDVLLEKVMDAGVMDDKRYILPLRYQYPIILTLEDVLGMSAGPMCLLPTLSMFFPLSAIIALGRFPWTRKQLSQPFPSIWSCFPPWTRRALRLMVGFGPISYPLTDL